MYTWDGRYIEQDDVDDTPPRLSREVTRKARKVHQCSSCKGRIEIGESYRLVEALFDEVGEEPDWFRMKTCQRCQAEFAGYVPPEEREEPVDFEVDEDYRDAAAAAAEFDDDDIPF